MEQLRFRGAPFPVGLTFIRPSAMTSVAPGASDPASTLAEAASALRASFAFVDSSEPWAEQAAEALIGADVAPLWTVSGPLWPIIQDLGAIEGLRQTLTRPEHVGTALDAGLDALLSEVGRGARQGVRAIVLAEDLAGTEGPLVAPDFAIAELLPRYERVVRSAHSLGLPAIFHSDGDVRLLLPAIARAGFAAVHVGGGLSARTFERVFWAAREAGLAVIGGLLTAELDNAARAEAIGSEIGVLAQAGGLFVADDGGITTAREFAGLVTALAAARAS